MLEQYSRWYLQENNGTRIRDPKANCSVCRNPLYRSEDFTVVRHYATNRFQCNVLKVTDILERMCSDFSPIFFFNFSTLFRHTLAFLFASSSSVLF
jgi:hypothetical protein